MAYLTPRHGDSWLPALNESRYGRYLPGHHRREGPPTALIVAGVVVLGIGLMSWHYLGADLRRYLKIHSM